MSTDSVEDVLVVGGGDVGLLAGLSIRKLNPDLGVTVVDDFDEDPPAVGKSTYREIVPILHGFLEIPLRRFLREVRPLWKASVYFRDWCGCEPFHYPFDDSTRFPGAETPGALQQYYLHYHEIHADPDRRTVNEAMVERGKSPVFYDPGEGGYSSLGEHGDRWAYHLDLNRFEAFLRTLCEERDVALVDDRITNVDADSDRIRAVHSGDRTYETDLYVDASGFNRVLKGELDDAFREFELPLDAAVNAKVERPLSEAVPATVIESGERGWFWQIDTYGFRDLGYVYGSAFASEDEAADEFLAHCGDAVGREELTSYGFDSGYYRTPWQGNCVAVGNAVGFVEPLQSTGLTANAQSARKLANLLSSQGTVDYSNARELYNAWVGRLWESIYDFVSVHYRHAAGDTEFWEAARSVPASERVRRLEDHFDRSGFDTKTSPLSNGVGGGPAISEPLVFPPIGFHSILHSMGAESGLYEDNDVAVSDEAREEVAAFYDSVEDTVEQLLSVEEVYSGVLQVE